MDRKLTQWDHERAVAQIAKVMVWARFQRWTAQSVPATQISVPNVMVYQYGYRAFTRQLTELYILSLN